MNIYVSEPRIRTRTPRFASNCCVLERAKHSFVKCEAEDSCLREVVWRFSFASGAVLDDYGHVFPNAAAPLFCFTTSQTTPGHRIVVLIVSYQSTVRVVWTMGSTVSVLVATRW
jgi:hypothetical protein